jgi:hypothetical protein
MVHAYLRNRANQWVDGPELANAEVGGSEGLKRLRELRADGINILMRPHPDTKRDIHQYMLVLPKSQVGMWNCTRCGLSQNERPAPTKTTLSDDYIEAGCPECLKRTMWMLRRFKPDAQM